MKNSKYGLLSSLLSTFVSMKEILNITLIQSNLFWEDVDANLAHFDNLLSDVKETDIILLPEMFNTAFFLESNHLAEIMDGKTVNWMKEISKNKNCAIAGSLMVQEKGKVYNRLVWISKKNLENFSTFMYLEKIDFQKLLKTILDVF